MEECFVNRGKRSLRLGMQVAKLHERIGNLRCEFLQEKTTIMVESYAVIATKNCGHRI
jgi:putative transposase